MSIKPLQKKVSWREKFFILRGFAQLPTAHSAWDTAQASAQARIRASQGHHGIVLNVHFLAVSLSSAHKKIPQDAPSIPIQNSRMADGAEKGLQ